MTSGVYSSPFLQGASFSVHTPFHTASANRLDQSESLTKEEKRVYQQMIDCVARFGIDDDQALFNAADYCFDTPLGTKVHNMISLQEYADCMSIDLAEDGLDAELLANRLGGFLLTRITSPLQKVFEEGDRLIIGSLGEVHMYAMRKCEEGEWAVIDSLLSTQEHVDRPLEWLLSRVVAGYQFIALEQEEPQPFSSAIFP